LSGEAVTDVERARYVEQAFRQVNDQIRLLSEELFRRGLEEELELVCECAATSCCERILLAAAEYDRISAQPGWFIVVPGHELAGVETVAERAATYVIVQKESSQRPAET
jgi:hypothetical protein